MGIDFSNIVYFIIGIGFGMAIIALFYILFVLTSMSDKMHIISSTGDLTQDECIEMIRAKQEKFKDKNLQGEDSNIAYMAALSQDLAYEIAGKFYPESKNPLFELSLDELIFLNQYISRRIDELLSKRGIRIVKKVKIATLVGIVTKSKEVKKTNDKYKITGRFKKIFNIVNLFNPVYWAKNIVINKTIDYVTRKILLIAIAIVGEETYKVYSKNVFHEDRKIDSNIVEIENEIKNDLK